MPFAMGCAKKLYEQNLHPRLLCSSEDLARLRLEIRSGFGKKIMDRMRVKVRDVIARIDSADDLAGLLSYDRAKIYTSFYRTADVSINVIAMVAALDGDADAFEAVRRLLYEAPRAGAPGFAATGLLAFDILYDRFSEKERRHIVRQVQSGARAGLSGVKGQFYKSAGGNITLSHGVGPLLSYLVIQGEPGVRDLTRDIAKLISHLEATLHVAINPEGFPEEDTGYGTCVAGWLSIPVEAARRAGLYDAYAQCPRFAKVGYATMRFLQPWGDFLSNTGDHPPTFDYGEFLLPRAATETGDPTLLWQNGTLRPLGRGFAEYHLEAFDAPVELRKGYAVPANHWSLLVLDDIRKQSIHPGKAEAPTAYCDPQRGIVSFRSGWRPDDSFVQFDGSQRSPAAQGHAHASAGHFSLTALGDYFSIDTSRYSNEQDQHSVTIINGKSGRTTHGQWTALVEGGILTGYHPGDFVDSASVDSSLQHNCEWARRWLGFVKGKGLQPYVWTVDDINYHDSLAEFWWQMQTSPENVITTRLTGATIRGWRQGNYLDVHFHVPGGGQFDPPHRIEVTQDEQTLSSHQYIRNPRERAKDYRRPGGMVQGIVFVRPRLLAKVRGLNGRILAVMVPRRRDERRPTVRRIHSLDNSLAVRITNERVEDTLIFAYEHNLLEAGDIVARGQWVVVRRSRKTDRVLDYALHNGTSLSVAGKTVT